ncbi:MAG: hypothetical protein AUH40_09455 [Chloroflexi bacterium 13_1_40CM_65_17]|nr:MAG: hypothetical protein AUH40_09455 [Chloroflexi bacterium 13_1_40CM_65_17]
MGISMSVELSVALFAGMAAAMIVPAVRRSVPRWIEALIWLGLIVACWLAVTNIEAADVRYMTESAAWGADQIVNTILGLMLAGALGWMADHRFAIANLVVLLVGADILLLALLRAHREGEAWQPRIMLGEWVEVPLHREPVLVPAAVPSAIDKWNRRAEHAAAVLAAAFFMWFVQLLIWTRDVVVPQARARQAQAVAAGRVQAVAGLEAMRMATREWRQAHAMAIPEVGGVSTVLTDDQVINIRALLSAQSIGWYGPIEPAPADIRSVHGRQEDESDRLAS